VTYRDELAQAHRRIEQLEDELREEREKQEEKEKPAAPPPDTNPVIRMAPSEPMARTMPALAWWPLPSVIVAAAACLLCIGLKTDPLFPWVFASALAGCVLLSVEVLLRWRNDGERTVLGRILIVLAVIVGAPAIIAAFVVGGPIFGIVSTVVAAIAGIVALIRWIAKGDS
jgi:hypothetical protein